jgi:hypothetical protein
MLPILSPGFVLIAVCGLEREAKVIAKDAGSTASETASSLPIKP